MMDVVTIGWLTVDDIVLTDGCCHRSVLGGGALYSAVGADIFSEAVGIHSVCGKPYVERAVAEIAARGIDPSGIATMPGNGLELWLLHESATDKQQLPKLTSSSANDMDRHRGAVGQAYRKAAGFHIAPQSPAGSVANALDLSCLSHRPVITMDILSDVFIDKTLYYDLDFLRHLSAFLPSEAEIVRIWGAPSTPAWLTRAAKGQACHMIAKLGGEGSLVCEAQTGRLFHVPALPVDVVDTTGAGDAYCGGFVAGLVAGQSLELAAAMGTVAASYVVEATGALATTRPSPEERDRRLRDVLSRVRTFPS
jgi:sugar/nucleoside kinase (ribokinase family)